MMTVDNLAETVRTYLLADAALVTLLPGGWLYDRQRQTTTETTKTGYGVIHVDWVQNVNSSSFIFRWYNVTLAGWLLSNSRDQSAFQLRLATLLDFKQEDLMPYIPVAAGSGIVMVSPAEVSQKVADELKSGNDMTPVMGAWSFQVCDARV